MTPWFALYVTAARQAVRELHEAGFETWAPTRKRLTWRRREPLLTDVPLIQGYVFARVSPRFADAVACEHVAYIVSSAGAPRPVPDSLLDPIRILIDSGRMDDRLPGTRSRPRKIRARGLESLEVWFDAAQESLRAAA